MRKNQNSILNGMVKFAPEPDLVLSIMYSCLNITYIGQFSRVKRICPDSITIFVHENPNMSQKSTSINSSKLNRNSWKRKSFEFSENIYLPLE